MKEVLGIETQSPEAVGRSVALLIADTDRTGQYIFSRRGEYREIEKGLLQAALSADGARCEGYAGDAGDDRDV